MSEPTNNTNDSVEDFRETGFYNAQDGLKGRDGGPYLDHVERQQAEINRARVEGREPVDLNGPLPATAGTTMVTAAQVIDNSIHSNPSMANRPGFAAALDDKAFEDKRDGNVHDELDKVSIANPLATVPVDTRTDNGGDESLDVHPTVGNVAGAPAVESGTPESMTNSSVPPEPFIDESPKY